MVKLYEDGIYLRGGSEVVPAAEAAERGITQTPEDAKRGTIAYSILQAHNTSGAPEALKIRFDAMASHDITFVGIIQTARASGMEQFPRIKEWMTAMCGGTKMPPYFLAAERPKTWSSSLMVPPTAHSELWQLVST